MMFSTSQAVRKEVMYLKASYLHMRVGKESDVINVPERLGYE
jgi:hypothetical protein